MYDNKELIKAMIAFSEDNRDSLAQLNKTVLAYYDKDNTRKVLDPLAKTMKSSAFLGINAAVSHFVDSYKSLMSEKVRDTLIGGVASIQEEIIRQISQSCQTNMIKGLRACFENANYSNMLKIMNETVSSNVISAVDIAFLKTTELPSLFPNGFKCPRGFSQSLKSLNKATAYDVANNKSLKYSTKENLFISESGKIDSKCLNVVCSGRLLLNSEEGELFTDNELIDFCSFLARTPMHGMMNNVGQKIQELIMELYIKKSYSIGFDETCYYHCRTRRKDEAPFTYTQMLKAPVGLPWSGRYNHQGQSHYYFSNTQKGAEAEVIKHKSKNEVLQTIRILPHKEIDLLDLSQTIRRGKTFLKFLRFKISDVNDKTPREYLIPCFVAECCKMIGFDGIKYQGSKEYNNYVVWSDGYFEDGGVCF